MAVQEQTPYIEFIGNGVTTNFHLEFDVLKQDHLIVLVDDVEPNHGEWSFDSNLDDVCFSKAPKSGARIKVRRDTPLKREKSYNTFDNSFKPKPVDADFDNIWRKLQEMGVLNWMVNNDVKDLNDYVNSLNDETRQAFLDLIQKQGISMHQLDAYYRDLYKKIADINTDKGWLAELIADKNGRNQQEINDQLLNAKTIDLSYLKVSDGFDISDLVNEILKNSSNTPIELILPKAEYFICEKKISTPEDSKGVTIDLNGSRIKAGPLSEKIGYLFDLYSITNNPVVVKNGVIDGSLRAQNLFESTNVPDLDKGVNGIFCTGINVIFENLEIVHLYGQTTKCFCRNFIARNVNIDDCGGHWYINDGYDMFGDAFYIGTGWNTTGTITVTFENVTANGKHSDQYPENHQAGSPLTQVLYSRIGITIEQFGGTHNNIVYLTMTNCDFQNYERGFHQEITGIISYINLLNTKIDCCVLFGAYLTDAMYASAKNSQFGFYDSHYNGSKGLTRGYSGSSFVDLDACQVINKGTESNYQMFGTAGNLTAKNTIFYGVSGIWCSSTNVNLIDCSIDVKAHSDLTYLAWASSIYLRNVNISYSGTEISLKTYAGQLGSFKELINVSFDRIYIPVDTTLMNESFKDVSLIVPDQDVTSFKGSRYKVISQTNNKVKQLPHILWGVSENCFFGKRYYKSTFQKPADASPLNLVDNNFKLAAKKVSLFIVVVKAHDDALNRLNNISYDTYGDGYYVCVAKYEPSATNSIKLLSQVYAVGSTTEAGYNLTIDTSLKVTTFGSYAAYVHIALIPYSEIDTLPYVPDGLYARPAST